MPSPTSSARQPCSSRASRSPRSRATRSARVASSDGVDALLRADLADPRRHQRDRRAQVAVQLVAVGRGQRRRRCRCPSATAARISLPRFPVRAVPRRRAPATSRAVVLGCRWAMPSTARSGSTWRTGTSTAIARRSRHARHRPGHATGARLQHAHVLEAQPCLLGSVPLTGRCAAPRRPRRPTRCGRARQLAVELGPAAPAGGDVGGGVVALLVGQRPPQPVGEAVALRRGDLQLGPQQRHQRRRAVAEEPGGQLGVVDVRRHRAAGVGEHVEVLLGGVQHGHARRSRTAGAAARGRPPTGRPGRSRRPTASCTSASFGK